MTTCWPDTHLPLEDDDQELIGRRTAQLARVELIGYERVATRITDVTPILIPGLLQTRDYAQMVLGQRPGMDRRVQLRMERAGVLTRDEYAVEFHAIIHEEALTRPVAPAAVMRAQLAHLRRMNKLPNVTIQVVPADVPGPLPSFAGPFMILEFGDSMPPLVHLEHYRAGVFLWEHSDVRSFLAAADEMTQKAMTPVRSAGVIADIASHGGGGTPTLQRSTMAARNRP